MKIKIKKNIFKGIKKIFNLFGLEISRKKTNLFHATMNLWLTKLKIKTVIDVGANEGQFLEFIRQTLPTCKTICFEPMEEPFNKLQERYGNNDKVVLKNFALGKKKETLAMFKNSFSPSSSILKMSDKHIQSFPFTKNVTEQPIKVETLDNISPSLQIEKPFLIKIDVQGYEKFVIEGGIETIKQADVIIVELSYKELYDDQPLFDEVYALLVNNNFVISGILDQLKDPNDGEFLQCDAIFINKNVQKSGKRS